MRIAMLHYAGPPVVGGVESTIAYHARVLTGLGHDVCIVAGSGGEMETSEGRRVEMRIDPLFGSTAPENLEIKKSLDSGHVLEGFDTLTRQVQDRLRVALADCDAVIVHNVPTMNKNLPLTAALFNLHNELSTAWRLVAWCHDLAWTNPLYADELHPGYPWDLLRKVWPGVRYVTVSEMRLEEATKLFGVGAEQVTVVPPGIDPARFFRWTPTTVQVAERLHLLDADGLLLLPARITRRKNIELGVRILGEVRRQSGRDYRLIVTGPPGPHNPSNPGYLGTLLDLRHSLGLDDYAHFLYAFGMGDEPLVPDDDMIADLYQMCDGLLFPSTQEGFGIPILEAGLSGLPAFCADIPPLRATGQGDAQFFDPGNGDPAAIARQILDTLEASPTSRLKVRVRQGYRWDKIVIDHILPLLDR